MNVGDRLSLIVPPEDAYGDPDPKLIKWYPKVLLKDGDKFKVNTMIMWHSDDGLAARPAMVTDETEDLLQIDLNHPYAGKTLKYELELVSLQD
jgi:FKBP-type peptidyl-prolyl cis-trans isomerase 2